MRFSRSVSSKGMAYWRWGNAAVRMRGAGILYQRGHPRALDFAVLGRRRTGHGLQRFANILIDEADEVGVETFAT